jgi:hypothetical protein
LFAEFREGPLGALRLAEAHEGLQQPFLRERDEVVRRGERPGQPLGGPEGGQRIAVAAECQLEQPADLVDRHRVHGLGCPWTTEVYADDDAFAADRASDVHAAASPVFTELIAASDVTIGETLMAEGLGG